MALISGMLSGRSFLRISDVSPGQMDEQDPGQPNHLSQVHD